MEILLLNGLIILLLFSEIFRFKVLDFCAREFKVISLLVTLKSVLFFISSDLFCVSYVSVLLKNRFEKKFEVHRAYSRPLLGATFEPNLAP